MGAVEVNGLRYVLPSGRVLLDDVSFRVGSGDHVALVGANGSGKTTLLRLLASELDPTRGQAVVHGAVRLMPQLVSTDRRTVGELLASNKSSEPEYS